MAKASIFDYEVRSQSDRQIRVLRDTVKNLFPADHDAQKSLDQLLPKEFRTPDESVLEIWYSLQLPQKSQLDLEQENQIYIAGIQENYNRAKDLSFNTLYHVVEPAILSLTRQFKNLIISETNGVLMYSYQESKYIQIQYNKDVTKTLFSQVLSSSENTNIYCLLIQILRRCEELGFSPEQVKLALIILCTEKLPHFKSTLTSLRPQGVKVMLTHLLAQTSQQKEEEFIYERLKSLKRVAGAPKMMTLITLIT